MTSLTRSLVLLFVGVVVGLLVPSLISPNVVASLLNRTPQNLGSSSVRIGALVCLTGECAEWGTESLNGIKLAVEEINRDGGVLGRPLTVAVEDSRDVEPRETVTAFKRLTSDGALHYIIGPTWTPGGMAIAPLARHRNDLIVTSPSLGVKDFDHAGENLFNTWPHDETRARLLARTALQRGQKRVAIFSSQQPWSKQLGDAYADEIVKGGGEVLVKTEPLESERNLRAEALKIVEASPDAVFLSVITDQAGIGARELRKLQLNKPLYIVLLDETTREVAGDALDSVISTDYPAAAETFMAKYKERFGKTPRVSADTAYDTVKLYAEAMRRAGSVEPSAVLPALKSVQGFKGASGELTFDSEGGITKSPFLVQLQNGKLEPLS